MVPRSRPEPSFSPKEHHEWALLARDDSRMLSAFTSAASPFPFAGRQGSGEAIDTDPACQRLKVGDEIVKGSRENSPSGADYNPCPPATAMDWPVTQDANGEARNSATLAISSAWPMRPNGIEASVLL